MTQHRKVFMASAKRVAAFAAIGSWALMAVPAHATPASGFSAAQQWKGVFAALDIDADKTGKWDLKLNTKDDSDVYVTRNAIAAGGQSGWHTHPGPSLITVTVGEITAYDGLVCAPTHYVAGETFVDPGGGHVHLLRNESSAAAETVAIQFIPAGATRRI